MNACIIGLRVSAKTRRLRSLPLSIISNFYFSALRHNKAHCSFAKCREDSSDHRSSDVRPAVEFCQVLTGDICASSRPQKSCRYTILSSTRRSTMCLVDTSETMGAITLHGVLTYCAGLLTTGAEAGALKVATLTAQHTYAKGGRHRSRSSDRRLLC